FSGRIGVSGRREIEPELIQDVRRTFEKERLKALICVGGDGSLTTALQFHEAGLPVVGVPKTIDNDLDDTAYTFGFNSAVHCATDALDRLHTTAASHGRVMVLEVMGRHTGWIALHAGIAGGGDVILIPEIPWNFENVVAKINDRTRMGKEFTLVVAAEGAELPDGTLLEQETGSQHAQSRLGGIGDYITSQLRERIDQEVRSVVLGHLQRGGAPSTFDRVLATQYGVHATRLIYQGKFGRMVSYDPPIIQSVPIAEAVERLRTVDPMGSAVVSAKALGISFGDAVEYECPFE
ncbi:MAG: ATP-dependent 6-phosphofructokinase, partial [Planctomycetota bacterium]